MVCVPRVALPAHLRSTYAKLRRKIARESPRDTVVAADDGQHVSRRHESGSHSRFIALMNPIDESQIPLPPDIEVVAETAVDERIDNVAEGHE